MWIAISLAGQATAACPTNPPAIKWKTKAGDQRVSASELTKLLAGKTVKSSGGTEVYRADGSYVYKTSKRGFEAPSYKFYADGTRCAAYATPRFDLYVINGKRLVLVNAKGRRYASNVSN